MPILTFTVFSISPLDTTTAFIWRGAWVAAAAAAALATFWIAIFVFWGEDGGGWRGEGESFWMDGWVG